MAIYWILNFPMLVLSVPNRILSALMTHFPPPGDVLASFGAFNPARWLKSWLWPVGADIVLPLVVLALVVLIIVGIIKLVKQIILAVTP